MLVEARVGRLRECSQGELRLYIFMPWKSVTLMFVVSTKQRTFLFTSSPILLTSYWELQDTNYCTIKYTDMTTWVYIFFSVCYFQPPSLTNALKSRISSRNRSPASRSFGFQSFGGTNALVDWLVLQNNDRSLLPADKWKPTPKSKWRVAQIRNAAKSGMWRQVIFGAKISRSIPLCRIVIFYTFLSAKYRL